MNTPFKIIITLTLALGLNPVHAATLTLTPSTNFISNGANISLVLGITGMGQSTVGAYDLSLFNPNRDILSFTGGSFGSGLGVTLLDTMALDGNGLLNIAQLSLESVANLNAIQSDSLMLATLNFHVTYALSNPTSIQLGTSINTISDGNGDPLPINNAAHITLPLANNPLPSAVPLPAAWLLFSAGLAVVEGTRRWSLRLQKE